MKHREKIIIMNAQTPVHKHDCESCRYLGTVEDNGKKIDCYWCGKSAFPNLSSVLGRYGSEGPEYYSSHPYEAFAEKEKHLLHASKWYLFALLQATRVKLYTPT